MCMWSFNWDDHANFLQQTSQANGCSPVWTRMCCFKLSDLLKFFLQTSHTNGRSSVWMRMWCFKLPDLVKFFVQTSHTKWRSPVWMCMWCFKWDCHPNFLPQTSQANRPVWMFMWRFKSPDPLKFFVQTSHTKERSRVWMRMWWSNWATRANILSQHWQVNSWTWRWVSNSLKLVNFLLQTSHVNWLLLRNLRYSFENTDCCVLWDLCGSPLLLSEKLCVRSSFVLSSTIEWKSNKPVQHTVTTIKLSQNKLTFVHWIRT